MVNVELLKIGKTYKYRELCELFEEKVKTSDSKKAQLKEWKRFFGWENPTTQKYVVTKIYEEAKEKTDLRKNNGGNNTSKYKELDSYIMNCLVKKRILEGTIRTLLIDIGILTEECTAFNPKHKKRIDIEKGIESEFCDNAVNSVLWKMSIVSNATKSALWRLHGKKKIKLEPHVMLVFRNNKGIFELNESDSEHIYEIRSSVRKRLNLSQKDLFIEENNEIYSKEVIKEIETEYKQFVEEKLESELDGGFIEYLYTSYKVYLLDDKYEYDASVSIRRITSLFVKEMGYSILCSYLCKNYYLDTNVIVDIGNYMQRLFTYLDYDMWMDYWNDVKDDDRSKEDVFVLGFVDSYMKHAKMQKKAKVEEKKNSEEKIDDKIEDEKNKNERNARNWALQRLDEKLVEEIEAYVPEFSWESVYIESLLVDDDDKNTYTDMAVSIFMHFKKMMYFFIFETEEQRQKDMKISMENFFKEIGVNYVISEEWVKQAIKKYEETNEEYKKEREKILSMGRR